MTMKFAMSIFISHTNFSLPLFPCPVLCLTIVVLPSVWHHHLPYCSFITWKGDSPSLSFLPHPFSECRGTYTQIKKIGHFLHVEMILWCVTSNIPLYVVRMIQVFPVTARDERTWSLQRCAWSCSEKGS